MTTPKYLNKREFTTVLGKHTIENNKTDLTLDNSGDNYIQDLILRDPTYKSMEFEIEQAAYKGLVNFAPEDYIKAAKTDLLNISKKLKKTFVKAYKLALSTSYTEKEAVKMATEQMNKQKDFLLSIHKKKFPFSMKDFKMLH